MTDHAYGAALDGRAAAHLAACPGCRALLAEERRVVAAIDDAMRGALGVSASPGFGARAAARARAESAAASHRPDAMWLTAAAAAIVALAVWAGAIVQRDAASTALPSVPAVATPALSAPAPNLTRAPVDGSTAGAPSSVSERPARRPPVAHMAEAAPHRDAATRFEVIVPPTQLQAIARLWELAEAGAIQDIGLRKDGPLATPPASLAIEPLAVTEIIVPDVEIVSGTAAVLRALDTSREPL